MVVKKLFYFLLIRFNYANLRPLITTFLIGDYLIFLQFYDIIFFPFLLCVFWRFVVRVNEYTPLFIVFLFYL